MKLRAGEMPQGKHILILEFFRDRKGFLDCMRELEPQLKAIIEGKA